MRILFTITVLLLSLSGFSQRDYLYGVINATDTQLTIEGVHITGTSSGLLTSSNNSGRFRIPVQVGDTLTLTHVGYETLQYVVENEPTDELLEFWLTSETTQLPEVEVHVFPEYWRFKQQVLDTQVMDSTHVVFGLNAIPMDAYEIPANEKDVPIPDYNPPSVSISFDMTGLTKKGKEKKKMEKILARKEMERTAYRKFNREWVGKETKLSGDELTDFIAYCKFTPEYLVESTLFEIRERMMTLLAEFKTDNNKSGDDNYYPGS